MVRAPTLQSVELGFISVSPQSLIRLHTGIQPRTTNCEAHTLNESPPHRLISVQVNHLIFVRTLLESVACSKFPAALLLTLEQVQLYYVNLLLTSAEKQGRTRARF